MAKATQDKLSIDYLEKLRQRHVAVRLLNAANFPLIISFLYKAFIEPNCRSIPMNELKSSLENYLFHIQQIYGDNKYPRSAKQYLEEWAGDDYGFIRKYYTQKSDEPEVDITPATETAINWIINLEQKQFIGTESRLLIMFQLLREIALDDERDPVTRINYLKQQKQEIEEEIQRAEAGIVENFDSTQIKERFMQAEDMAKQLLSDFRQVEFNFRELDKDVRERIAASDLTKGKLLDEIFEEHDFIRESDQGKSFKAFWEFLMSRKSQDELENLLEKIYNKTEVLETEPQPFLKNIKYNLLEAGEKVYHTNSQLAEQLRKYLDDQTYLENKRILNIIKSIEAFAIQIKNTHPDTRCFERINSTKANVNLVMDRQLFNVPKNPIINTQSLETGSGNIDIKALYNQNFIDEARLRENIEKALNQQSQISLTDLIELYPIQDGVAEIIGYFHIASNSIKAVIDSHTPETVMLETDQGCFKKVKLPKIIFAR